MKKLPKTQKSIYSLIAFCILLLMIRIKITNSIFFGFLLWNLFLAVIPYIISSKIKTSVSIKESKIKLISVLFIWMIFLPNAPYIITDFIHLQHTQSTLVWLDLFLIFTFANTGLLLATISLNDIYQTVKLKWNQKTANYFITIAIFLCGFGIYLGRFLRFNSWDLLISPLSVIKRSLLSFNESKTWMITFGFGTLIWILFSIFRNLKEAKTSV